MSLTYEPSSEPGLFLQKTNIIRDFLEDHEDMNEATGARRVFWPKEIWSEYTDDLSELTFGKNETQAVACLNHMVPPEPRNWKPGAPRSYSQLPSRALVMSAATV